MKILRQPGDFAALPKPIILAAGFFDGVHLGHRALLRSAIAEARKRNASAWAMTFNRHPLSVLSPANAPGLLFPLQERLRQMEEEGLDGVLLLDFSRELAAEEPETFIKNISPDVVFCGENWRFGKKGRGTPELLRKLGVETRVLDFALCNGLPISSTRIRAAVLEGRMEDAAAMLGKPFYVRGVVQHGRGDGTKTLECPTANIPPADEGVRLPFGVYVAQMDLPDGTRLGAVADFGVHPTFGAAATPLFEAHAIGYNGDLYGKEVKLSLLHYIRPERDFASATELSKQIRQDLTVAQSILAGK